MTNILITVAYDGTNYHGWQSQKNAITVQQTIESALCTMFSDDIQILGASRTDAGVHALGQRALFAAQQLDIPIEKLHFPINNLLPPDIRILKAELITDPEFHPIYCAKRKLYRYVIHNAPVQNPLVMRYAEFVAAPLNFEAMRRSTNYFVGEHDFKAFCAAGSTVLTTKRIIYDFSIYQEGDMITLFVTGSGFLYNMVRIIAGTLIDVGKGKIAHQDIADIIASADRKKAGKTAGPSGLTLMKVSY